MAINKRHRLAGKPIRQVLGFGNRSVVSEKGSIEVCRLRFQETIEFIEPSLKWAKSGVRPEMPFTDHAAHISSWLEYLRQQQFPERQAAGQRDGVGLIFMAKPLLIAPCKQTRPRWAAKRMGHVSV